MIGTQETEPDVNLVEAFTKMGLLCDRTGRVEDAAFHYQQALALGKNSPELQQNLGRVLQEQGDFTGAISSYQQVLAVNPDDVKALYNIGVAFQLQGKIEAAIHSYQQAIRCWANSSKKAHRTPCSGTGKMPVPQELNVLVGMASRSALKELLPYAINAYSNWGCILVQEGKFDGAIQVFQAAITIAPGDATLYNNLGIALLEQRKPEEAIALYRKAIELQPELVMARQNLGKAFQRLGLHAFAGECFEQAISQQPHYVSAYSDRAFSLMAQGKLAEAMGCFQNAISLQSEFVEDFCDRASLLVENDELDRAKIACARFIQALMGKQNLAANSVTGKVGDLVDGGRTKVLTTNQLPIATIFEHLVQAYFHLGNALFEYGGYEQAESYYQKALQIQPHNIDIYLRLGNCLAKQKRFSAAIVVYRMVLVIAGDRSDISEQLQAVLKKQQKLIDSSSVREGLKPLANSESPLKWTKELYFSPLKSIPRARNTRYESNKLFLPLPPSPPLPLSPSFPLPLFPSPPLPLSPSPLLPPPLLTEITSKNPNVTV